MIFISKSSHDVALLKGLKKQARFIALAVKKTGPQVSQSGLPTSDPWYPLFSDMPCVFPNYDTFSLLSTRTRSIFICMISSFKGGAIALSRKVIWLMGYARGYLFGMALRFGPLLLVPLLFESSLLLSLLAFSA